MKHLFTRDELVAFGRYLGGEVRHSDVENFIGTLEKPMWPQRVSLFEVRVGGINKFRSDFLVAGSTISDAITKVNLLYEAQNAEIKSNPQENTFYHEGEPMIMNVRNLDAPVIL